MACSLVLGALALLLPSTGSAQTFVDVGVWTPRGGGRVVVGGAPVYGAPIYTGPVYGAPVYVRPVYRAPIYRYRPVYVAPPVYVAQPYYRYGWNKRGRGPYGPGRYSARGYYDGRYGGRSAGRDYRRRR
jgi:hypothetical protein